MIFINNNTISPLFNAATAAPIPSGDQTIPVFSVQPSRNASGNTLSDVNSSAAAFLAQLFGQTDVGQTSQNALQQAIDDIKYQPSDAGKPEVPVTAAVKQAEPAKDSAFTNGINDTSTDETQPANLTTSTLPSTVPAIAVKNTYKPIIFPITQQASSYATDAYSATAVLASARSATLVGSF